MRIVSLVPSATEIVCLLDAQSQLVGRSHECDHPASLTGVPIVTSSSAGLTLENAPSAIDQAVRDQLATGQSLYHLDADRLAALGPDLILTQDLCVVCAIDQASVRRIAQSLPHAPRILSLNPETFEDVLDDVLRIGDAIDRQDRARDALVALRERVFRAIDYVNSFATGPSVAFIEWTDPIYIGGHWTPQLIERAGGMCPLNPTQAVPGSGAAIGPQQASRKAGKSIRIPADILAASKPEALIISPCGVDLPRTRAMAAALAVQPWFADLPAVRTGRVALVDGNQMFSRPGPRLVDAFEWLVGWLNDRPEVIPPGFPWEPWQPL
jgi:iron complex transport system substrate-binding protein